MSIKITFPSGGAVKYNDGSIDYYGRCDIKALFKDKLLSFFSPNLYAGIYAASSQSGRAVVAIYCVQIGLFILLKEDIKFISTKGQSASITQDCAYIHFEGGTRFVSNLLTPSFPIAKNPTEATIYSSESETKFDMLRIKYLALILLQQRSSIMENPLYTPKPLHKDVSEFHVRGIGSFSLLSNKITIRFEDTVILIYNFPQTTCTCIDAEGENSELRLEFALGFERQVGILNQFIEWVEGRETPRIGGDAGDGRVDVKGVLERNKVFLDGG
jgi:hypothetical protein